MEKKLLARNEFYVALVVVGLQPGDPGRSIPVFFTVGNLF